MVGRCFGTKQQQLDAIWKEMPAPPSPDRVWMTCRSSRENPNCEVRFCGSSVRGRKSNVSVQEPFHFLYLCCEPFFFGLLPFSSSSSNGTLLSHLSFPLLSHGMEPQIHVAVGAGKHNCAVVNSGVPPFNASHIWLLCGRALDSLASPVEFGQPLCRS